MLLAADATAFRSLASRRQDLLRNFFLGITLQETQLLLLNSSRYELHWLPMWQRLRCKTAVMVYKCIHGLAPSYLASHCEPTSSCPGQLICDPPRLANSTFLPRRLTMGREVSLSLNQLSGTAYLLNFGHLTSRWTFAKPDWRHLCLTTDLAHLVYFILILRSTNVLNNNINNNNNISDTRRSANPSRNPSWRCKYRALPCTIFELFEIEEYRSRPLGRSRWLEVSAHDLPLTLASTQLCFHLVPFLRYSMSNNSVPLKSGSGSFKVIVNDRTLYDHYSTSYHSAVVSSRALSCTKELFDV